MTFRTLVRAFALGGAIAATIFVSAIATAQAREAENGARTFLATIYQAYVGSSSGMARGVALDSAETVRRYFSPGLASLIIDDNPALRAPGEASMTGSDPFIGRGSWDIANLAIEVKDLGPVKAAGTVRFTNFGLPETVEVELLKVGDEWRIAEVKWGSLTLRSLYRKKWQAALEINRTVQQ